ncbi:hypothetical protein GCM10023237_09400 [Streptomyces coeruleoprunus]
MRGIPGRATDANAYEHARGPYEVCPRWAAGKYICEIHDGDPFLPVNLYVVAAPSWHAATAEGRSGLLTERGRGLRIVNDLACGQWGFHVTDCGTKAAWFALGPTVARRRGDAS